MTRTNECNSRRVWARKPFPDEIERSEHTKEESAGKSDITAEKQ